MKPIISTAYVKVILGIILTNFSIVYSSYAQNIGVNTTGVAPAAANLFEVLQPSNTASYRGIYTLHSGTGANSTGIYAEHTGAVAGSTGYAFQAIKSGASLTNIASYLSASGASNNYALIVPSTGGNVGIATTAPSGLFQVGGTNSAARNFQVDANGLITGRFDDNSIPDILTLNNRGITAVNHGVDIAFGLNIGGGAPVSSGLLRVASEDTYAAGANQDSYMIFGTALDGTLSEKMRINSNGNVGIGSSTPGNKLTLYGTASNLAGPHLSAFTDADASNPVFQILNWNSTNVSLSFGSFYDGAWKSSDAGSSFQVYKLSNVFRIRYGVAAAGAAVTWNEGISLLTDGNVGIGNAAPGYKLDVTGTAHVDGLNVNGAYSLPTADGTANYVLKTNGAGAISWSQAWTSSNDGSGSTLDADLLDGISSGSFLRSDASDVYSGGVLQTYNDAGIDVTNAGQINGLQVYQPTVNADALMTFHIGGDYAVHFGLDGNTNDLTVGGWSMGATKYKIWHEGNDGSGSTLDADLLDGISSAGFIQNQTASAQTANFRISGDGDVNGVYKIDAVNAVYGSGTDIYGGMRVIQNMSSTTQDGMYINYNSAGTVNAHLRFYANGTTERMRINASTGNVGIGAAALAAPSQKLQVDGRVKSNGINETSDARLKKEVVTIADALQKVNAIRGVNYFWKTEEFPDKGLDERKQMGVIAQEVEKVMPEVVITQGKSI